MASNRTGTLPSLRISVSPEKHAQIMREMEGVKNGARKVINGAINKELPRVRTRVTRELGDLVTAKANNIRSRITVTKSTPDRLRGSVNVQLRQIALINFKNSEKRKKTGRGTSASGSGVTVQIYKGGAAQVFPHAFIAKGKRDQAGGEGNRHIFQRVSNAAGKRVGRFPLVSLKGISLMKEFEKRKDMQHRVQDFIEDDFPKQLDSQMSRFLKRPLVPVSL